MIKENENKNELKSVFSSNAPSFQPSKISGFNIVNDMGLKNENQQWMDEDEVLDIKYTCRFDIQIENESKF